MTEGADYDVREHYVKYEYRVAMRDGARLLTSGLVPAATQRVARSRTQPSGVVVNVLSPP